MIGNPSLETDYLLDENKKLFLEYKKQNNIILPNEDFFQQVNGVT